LAVEELLSEVVSDLLEDRPLFSEEERVSRAAGRLREAREYEVFTSREKHLFVSTVRDILAVKNLQQTRLETVSYPCPEIGKGETIGRAAQLMFEYRLRAIPSYREGDIVRVISARSIIRRMATSVSSSIRAQDIMTPTPVTVMADETAEKARQIMLRRSFDHLPVIRDARVSGMLTSSHLLERLLPEVGIPAQFRGVEKTRFDYPVSSIADASVVTVQPEAGLSSVIDTILSRGSTYTMVDQTEEAQGIITLRDLMKPLLRRPKARLPFYIVGLPNEPFEAEAAKMKLERLGTSLIRTFPFIQEIRAIVKGKETRGPRRRYEVTVSVYTPRETHAFSSEGYDLPEVFDEIAPKLKRLLSERQSKVTGKKGASLRKTSPT
jgi:CBS domain-containing protein/ribosome-associated translation inhibitor RaiA